MYCRPPLYTRLLFLLVFLVAVIPNSFAEEIGNSSIKVLRSDNHKPIADAVIKIAPLAAKTSVKAQVGFTGLGGVYKYNFTEPVIVQVSQLSFATVTDTIYEAGDKTYELMITGRDVQDVVVTGQYGNNSAQKSVYNVRVIGNDVLMAKGATNLRDALQNELGIDLGQDAVFGSSISINGISGEGVKIMVDGVPIVGRLDGKLDLSQINISNIDHIEIVEGPLSVMYGTEAMGGVVNIITKTFQQEKINLNLKGYYESVGQYNVELNTGFTFKRHQLYLSGGRNFFNGFSTLNVPRYQEWKPKEQYFADAKYLFNTERLRFAISASFFRELMLDRSAPIKTLSTDNNDTAWTYVGIDGHYLTYRPRAAISFKYRFKDNYQLEALLAYSGFFRFSNTYSKDLVTQQEKLINDTSGGVGQDTTFYHQIVFRATYNMPAWKNRLNFQFGVDVNQEYTHENDLSGGNQKLGDYAVFGGVRITLVEGLDVQPAVRFSYNTKFSVPLIPSLNIRYLYKDKLVLRVSYGRGYRAPTLKELYLSFFDNNHAIMGNPDLKPEDGHNLTGSISYSIPIKKTHTITLTANGFYNNISQKIDFAVRMAPFPPDTYQYFNLKHYITYGTEPTVAYNWNRLKISAGVGYTAYRLNNTNNKSNVTTFGSTDFRASASYMIPKAEIGINIIYKYNGKKPLFSISGDIETGTRDAYHMLDVSLSRNFWKDRIQLTIGGKNLVGVTDVKATNVTGAAVAHSTDPNNVLIGWGRTFFATLILHFSK